MTARDSAKTQVSEAERVSRAFFDYCNAHDLNKTDSLVTDDFSGEAPGALGSLDKTQNRAYLQSFLTAFNDLHFTIDRVITQGDMCAVQWTATGTHSGQLVAPGGGGSLPPTGRRARVVGCTVNEIKHGKISRGYVYWDMVGLLAQLGAMPPI